MIFKNHQKLNVTKKIMYMLSIFLVFSSNLEAQEQQNTNIKDSENNNIEETLIDFTEFQDRLQSADLFPSVNPVQNKKLSELTHEDINPDTLQPNYQIEIEDMFYKNWLIQMNSSAKTKKTTMFSYAKQIQLKKPYDGKQAENGKDEKGKGQNTLGVRIFFPETPFHAYAEIMPRFEIPSYYSNKGKIISQEEKGKYLGVIHNVGEIKKISMDVSGRNFKNGIALRLKDNFGVIREYFMGYSYFASWRRLMWKNPSYLEAIDFEDLYRVPLYPRSIPYVKFHSLIVYRPAGEIGGDTITYFRKIDLWFDYAVNPSIINNFDIDDEGNWGILQKRAEDKRKAYLEKNADTMELLKAEIEKKGKNLEEKDILSSNSNQNTQASKAPTTQTPTP